MNSNSDDVRLLQEETLAGIRRICDPTTGAVIPSDLGADTAPNTCQSLTAWGQFDAVPQGLGGVSIPQALVWFPKQFPTALLRMSLQQTSVPQPFSSFDTDFLFYNLQSLKVVRPFFCPVEDSRDIHFSPDLPKFYQFGRLIGGYCTVQSDATSTTSVALAGTIEAGMLSDFTFAPDFDPPKLAQYTVSKKDSLLSVPIQEGVAMINGPSISSRFRGINGAQQLDEGNTTFTSLLGDATDSNTVPFSIDLPNMTSTGSLFPGAPVPGVLAFLSAPALPSTYSPQVAGTMTSKGLWISPWFTSSNTNVTNVTCPAVSPYDEPILRVQINLSQAGSTDGIPKMQNCMLAQVTMTDVWCYEYQNATGERNLQYVSSPGGVDVYPLTSYSTGLDVQLDQTNFTQGTNFVYPNITKTTATAPQLPGTGSNLNYCSQIEFVHRAVRPGYASNTNSYARGTGLSVYADPNQSNLMYAGTYISAVGVVSSSGAAPPPEPVKVQLLRVDFGVPNVEQELNSCLITQWRKVASGQSIVCNFSGFVQADPGKDLAPFQNSVRGNTEAIRMLTPHSMEFLRLLFNSQNVASFKRIFTLPQYKVHKNRVENLSWEELYNIVASVADITMRQQMRFRLSAHDNALAWAPFSWLKDVGHEVGKAASWVGKNVLRPAANLYLTGERDIGRDLATAGHLVSKIAPRFGEGLLTAAEAIPEILAVADGHYGFNASDLDYLDTDAQADAWFALLDPTSASTYGTEAQIMRPRGVPAYGFIFRKKAISAAIAKLKSKRPGSAAIAYLENHLDRNGPLNYEYTIEVGNDRKKYTYIFLPRGFSLKAVMDHPGDPFLYNAGFADFVKNTVKYLYMKSASNRNPQGSKYNNVEFQDGVMARAHARMLTQANLIVAGLSKFQPQVPAQYLDPNNYVITPQEMVQIRQQYPGGKEGRPVSWTERPYFDHARRSVATTIDKLTASQRKKYRDEYDREMAASAVAASRQRSVAPSGAAHSYSGGPASDRPGDYPIDDPQHGRNVRVRTDPTGTYEMVDPLDD